jgi:nucleoside-diphosphate-sugar epimerase
MRVFLAGASGAIGQRLVPQLVARSHQVTATTRSADKTERLRSLGAEPVVVDGLDAVAIDEAVAQAEPDAIIHQMTALADMGSLKHFDRGFAVTNELRTKGTDHLLAAAVAAGVDRFLVQSYTNWPNIREGSLVKSEEDRLDPNPPPAQRQSLAAIRYLEQAVLAAPLEGIVLRYGNFYGPGASDAFLELVHDRKLPIVGSGSGVWSWIHIDDAAAATVAALERGKRGIYNVVDDDPARVSDWLPYLAGQVGAKAPRHVPVWLGRLAAGEVGVSLMTQVRGSSNEKAKRELDWQPAWRSWRQGFRDGLVDANRTKASPLRAAGNAA